MAGMKPFFLTGANAKIKVNGVTLAYCTNLSYSVTVQHASPKVLGMYEPTSIEPLSYTVTGTFTVVRYVADVQDKLGNPSPYGVNPGGNGIGNWNPGNLIDVLSTNGRVSNNLNPNKLDKGTGFEINVLQKLADKSTVSVANIREARITKADFTLVKGAPAMQTFQFTALYVDEDSFLADFSGQGQQWS